MRSTKSRWKRAFSVFAAAIQREITQVDSGYKAAPGELRGQLDAVVSAPAPDPLDHDAVAPRGRRPQHRLPTGVGEDGEEVAVGVGGVGEAVCVEALSQRGDGAVHQCPSFDGRSNTLADPFTGYNYNVSYIGHGDLEAVKIAGSADDFIVACDQALAPVHDSELDMCPALRFEYRYGKMEFDHPADFVDGWFRVAVATVLAMDVEPLYLRQARWVAREYGLEHAVEFRLGEVYELAREREEFDLVWFGFCLYVTDRALLRLKSCECYEVVKREFDRLLPFGEAR